jgi:hypothetical protein
MADEYTVEAALEELREMFPEYAISICHRPQPEGHNFVSLCVRKGSDGTGDLKHFCYKSGLTLDVCMAQVKKWRESQS